MRQVAILLASLALVFVATPAIAAGPRNPYSSFNLSGINYGAQQWEKAQREGKVVWPYYNVPSRSYYRGSEVSRPTTRSYSTRSHRRWRR